MTETPSPTATSPPTRDSSRAALAGLVWTLVRTDFKARYHGTLGGFVWALLKPMATFVALIAVFSFVFPSEANYRINLLIGLFLYEFFSESTKVGMVSLATKGFLLTKSPLPSWVLVVTSISNALIALAVFTAILLAYVVASGRGLDLPTLGLFGLYLLCYLLVSVGISLATSGLFLRYRDLNQVWEVVLQAGFFLTPIFWPIGAIPERFHVYLFLWPPTPFVDFTRQVLVGGSIPSLRAQSLMLVETVLILAVGILIYRRLAPRTAEYV